MNQTIKSFLNETCSAVTETFKEYFRPLNRAYWMLAHRFHPHHRYHIIKPRTLTPGYCDPDHRLMHAMFHEVSEYAENKLMGEGLNGTRWTQKDFDYYDDPDTDWGKESFYEQVEVEKKIIELRYWWVIVRPAREQVEDAMLDLMSEAEPEGAEFLWILDSKWDDTPERKAYSKLSKQHFEIEEQWSEEDRRKMHEVVDLLPHIWY